MAELIRRSPDGRFVCTVRARPPDWDALVVRVGGLAPDEGARFLRRRGRALGVELPPDVDPILRRISELTDEGMNLEGIRRVMALEAENARLRAELERAREIAVHAIREAEKRPSSSGADLVPLKQAIAVFGQRPSIFDRD